jgi:uncharacterized radical SAM protein YgiQ
MFLPTTKNELNALGWKSPDVILVTGDTYVDSPFIGVAVIGKVLRDAGYTVAIIAQPDINSGKDIGRLGEPNLFWGITSGCMDSMISNYTPTNKRRKRDDLTGGGLNIRRPDMAVIVYTNLVRGLKRASDASPIIITGPTVYGGPFFLTPRPIFWSMEWGKKRLSNWQKTSDAADRLRMSAESAILPQKKKKVT